MKGSRILIVEDNPINQKITIMFLDKWDVQSAIANNGLEALNILASEQFDCILMDINMPVMDGLEASKAIRASNDPLLSGTPIVVISAAEMTQIEKEAKTIGFNAIIAKPVKPQTLKAILIEILGDSKIKAA